MLNFNQLRSFYYTAKYLNYTKAAAALFITQPAITAQIKAFEAFCGMKLFRKRGRSVYLTEEGKILFSHAEKVFAFEKEIENTIGDLRELKCGILRIGTTKAYAKYFMPLMLSTFHHAYPAIRFELNAGSSLEMTQKLLEFKHEIAIIAKAENTPGVQFIPFSMEEMVVVLPPNHHLTRSAEVSFKALAAEPFIMKDKGSGTRRKVDELFKTAGVFPEVFMETSNTDFIKQLVMRGEGISFLVREAVAQELNAGELTTVPLAEGNVYLDVSIAYIEEQTLSLPAQAFLETLKRLKYGRQMAREGIGALMARMLDQRNIPRSGHRDEVNK